MAATARAAFKIDAGQLQAKFKHAGDFGVSGNFNKANAAKFEQALTAHVNAEGTKVIQGTYRGNAVTLHVDPTSGRTVMSDRSGNFISAWKLNEKQLENVIRRGSL